MALRQKYESVFQLASSLGVTLTATEAGGKLQVGGSVPSYAINDQIEQAFEAFPEWIDEVETNMNVLAPVTPEKRGGEERTDESAYTTYTVKSGDTLGRIAQRLLGDAQRYEEIFELNRDQLDDPDQIEAGQELKIPQDAGA